ncbi:TlpA disulfide reductase family protein [Taibaiella chishuiensis]|uniref:Peroxiredoxin n=1 Tax=Taibaiella chishuiensis TaxID=1434707 RepID=A0A2P8DD13_9BACT|nr:TlpA disulfide reductase family protein [Taibaiella chishuiensis]PSK95111.1 peroxiredoxin [Taibaiella chishuiensis]
MKKKIYHILALFAVIAMASCSNTTRYFKVEGSVAGMPVQNVVLEEWGVDEVKLVDSVRSDKNGHFSLKGVYGEPALYRIKMGTKVMLIVVDGEHISLKAKWDKDYDLNNYTASGSPGSASLSTFLGRYRQLNEDILALQIAADSLNVNAAPDSVLILVQGESDQKYKEMTAFVKNYSDSAQSVPVALFAARVLLNLDAEIDYLKTFAGKMSKRYPDNEFVAEFRQKVKEKTDMMQSENTGPGAGSAAPEFTLTSLDGKPVALSSFKGKFVLVDFWASWCPPCRAENPNVVAAYKKYKDRNFTVLGVSLDNDREKWKQAVEKDGLAWTQVSDLKGWDSETAAKYGVQSIPANFLLDPSGKIIATNLRGTELDRVLNSKLVTTSQVAVGNTTAKK